MWFQSSNLLNDAPSPFVKRFWRYANKRCMDPLIGVCSQKEERPHEMLWCAILLVKTKVVEQCPDGLTDKPIDTKKSDELFLGCHGDSVLSPMVATCVAILHQVHPNLLEDAPGMFHVGRHSR